MSAGAAIAAANCPCAGAGAKPLDTIGCKMDWDNVTAAEAGCTALTEGCDWELLESGAAVVAWAVVAGGSVGAIVQEMRGSTKARRRQKKKAVASRTRHQRIFPEGKNSIPT